MHKPGYLFPFESVQKNVYFERKLIHISAGWFYFGRMYV